MAQNNKNDSNKEIHIDTATEHFGNFRNYTVAPKNKDVKTVDTMKKKEMLAMINEVILRI